MPAEPMVHFDNLRYWYPDIEEPVLDGVTMSLSAGEMAVVIGPSGCGKSTLMLALNGIVPKVLGGKIAGQVRVAGLDPLEHEMAEMALKVGLVFQDPDSQLASIFVRDEVAFGMQNLLYDRPTIMARMREALAFVGLDEMAQRDIFSLSGGEKQRVAIASILALQPSVIVLDEPTANLDPVGGYEVTQVVGELRSRLGATLLVVEHDISNLAILADRLIVMVEGRIRFDGPPREVLARHGREIRDELGLWIPQAAEVALELEREGRVMSPFPLTPEEIPIGVVPRLSGVSSANTSSPAAEPIVHAEHVRYSYGQGRPALTDVSCTIAAGEVIALLGQNGSGKSTFASMLVGLREPSGGLLEVAGHDAHGAGVGILARAVSYVFQYPEHQFVAETVFDDVAYGLRRRGTPEPETRTRVDGILRRFGLGRLEKRHPFTLSMGQKRRLSIADMLVSRPQLLILDEPTSGQDRRNTLALVDLLNGLRAELGLAIVIITHDMRLVASWCQRAIVLASGSTVFQGTPQELFAELDRRGGEAYGLRPPDGWRIGHRLAPVVTEVAR
jgi:energy-coupling factor transport system ATP-binding protein